MASVVISGDTSGSVTLSAPAVAGTTTLTLPSTSGTVLTTASTTGISGSAISTGTVAEAYGGTGTSTGYYGFKNRIINGAMVIDQRNAGASVTPATGAYTLDRWQFISTQASKFTVQQTPSATETGYATRVGAGFTNYLAMTVSSSVSIGASDYINIRQKIEGLNVPDLAWGTSNAKTVTLSFWAYSSLTGTFGGYLENSAGNRSYPFSYTISSANTWEQKTITIAGDQSGTWLTTNGIGIVIGFSLGAGSTYSGTAGSWGSTRYFSATGATSVVGTNGATFYITGVQLEKGSTATSFDYRPYGTELQLCQRYYYPVRGAGQFADVVGTTSTDMFFGATFPVEMRATPTMTGVLTALVVNNFSVAYTASGGSYSFNSTGTQGVSVRKSGFTSLNTSYRYFVNTTSIVVTADAEL